MFFYCFFSGVPIAHRFLWGGRLRKVFKRSWGGRGATILGWQQCAVRWWAVGLRARKAPDQGSAFELGPFVCVELFRYLVS